MKLPLASILILPLLLSGCLDDFFGCPDRLISVTPSPERKYKAVVRECGCKAQAGTYLVTHVVGRWGDKSCRATRSVARLFAEQEGGHMSVFWTDERNLIVRLNGIEKFTLQNQPKFDNSQALDKQPPDVRAKYALTPKISVVTNGP